MALYAHQERAVSFILANHGQAAIFADIGVGKTLMALSAYRQLREQDPDLKLLVICPISLIEAAWGEDIQKFTSFTYCNYRKKNCFLPRRLVEPDDIYIINYESLLTRNGLGEVYALVKHNRVMAVIDESSRIKNHEAKTSKILLQLRDYFKYRLVMSGSPAPNCETEYWPQITFVKPGVFHSSFYAFRNQFFYLGRGKQTAPGVYTKEVARRLFAQGFKYQISATGRKMLAERMAPICFRAKKEDCLDLPDQVDEVRYVDMGPKQQKAYSDMKTNLVAEIKDQQIAATVALTRLMKLRQICSGFAINERGEPVEIGENPKLKELLTLLEEAGDEQVIIWATFRQEIRAIMDALGPRAVALYGETADKDAVIQDFKAGQARYLVAHPRSAGHGLTFTNSHIQIFFSLDYSWECYEQSRGRTHRISQTSKCTYVHLLCTNSIDGVIHDVLKRKERETEIVLRFIKNQ